MKTLLTVGTLLAFFLLEPLSLQSGEGQTGSQEVLDRFGVEVNYVEDNDEGVYVSHDRSLSSGEISNRSVVRKQAGGGGIDIAGVVGLQKNAP